MAARGGVSPASEGLRYAEYSPPSTQGPDAETHQGLVSGAGAPGPGPSEAPPHLRASLPLGPSFVPRPVGPAGTLRRARRGLLSVSREFLFP